MMTLVQDQGEPSSQLDHSFQSFGFPDSPFQVASRGWTLNPTEYSHFSASAFVLLSFN